MQRPFRSVASGALLLAVSLGLPVVAFGVQGTRLDRRIIEPAAKSVQHPDS
ncbi:MAG: hypothetical protein IPF53_06635 [Blastocatellia bacterium]|nr:hypothetical protein [Blastocatellia bacterium]